jgi:hypothetical protein
VNIPTGAADDAELAEESVGGNPGGGPDAFNGMFCTGRSGDLNGEGVETVPVVSEGGGGDPGTG